MLSANSSPLERVAYLVSLYKTAGEGDYIGERVSQLEHSLQCAHLASSSGADKETIIAALLHDIGQFLPEDEVRALAKSGQDMQTSSSSSSEGSVGRVGHEDIGAEYLARLGFSKKVSALVGAHVAAKRYLCAVDPTYELSEASQASLNFQGGPMSTKEQEEFEADGWYREKCALRKCDDGAKVVGSKVEGLDVYRPLIQQHLDTQA